MARFWNATSQRKYETTTESLSQLPHLDVREEQSKKTSLPIVVIELGILIGTREEQPLKTKLPIVVMDCRYCYLLTMRMRIIQISSRDNKLYYQQRKNQNWDH